jgi:hypothetical protein
MAHRMHGARGGAPEGERELTAERPDHGIRKGASTEHLQSGEQLRGRSFESFACLGCCNEFGCLVDYEKAHLQCLRSQ